MTPTRADVQTVIAQVAAFLQKDHSFTKDRSKRDDHIVNFSWRKFEDNTIRVLWLNTWDPWDEVFLHLSVGDVASLEEWWAPREPMQAQKMTPGDVEFALERGARGAARIAEVGGRSETWAKQTDEALKWLVEQHV